MDNYYDNTKSSDLHEALTAQVPLAPLLNLPLELFLQIWDTLPLHTQASLTLTCRSLYVSYGVFTLPQLNLNTPHSRTYRSFLLRLLRRDLPDPSQWLCYDCLKFHPCAPTRHPRDSYIILLGGIGKRDPVECRPLHLHHGSGFPYCNSAYTLSQDYIASLLKNGNDVRPTVYKGSNRIESKTHGMILDYTIKLDVGFQGLETWSEYMYHIPYGAPQRRQWSNAPTNEHGLSPAQLTEFLSSTNHEFCPHLWFGDDFVAGDGSMSARLEARHLELLDTRPYCKDLPAFECRECHVYINIRVVYRRMVQIRVWQYFKPEVLKAGMRPARLDGWEWNLVKKEAPSREKRETALRRLLRKWR
jgi:hypothetical protein